MKLIWAHFRADVLDLVRLPHYLVPTLLFPGLFFLIFGMSVSMGTGDSDLIGASFGVFAVLGVSFFQFGIGIANDRRSPWNDFLHILPLRPSVRFTARALSAVLFAFVAASIVLLVASQTTDFSLPAIAWLRLCVALLLGAIPFALFGIALGYWAKPKAAVPIANLFYLLLSYGGALWFPPDALPPGVAHLSPFLPTRRWAEIAWSAALETPWHLADWLWLLAYTVLFGWLAVRGYARDEGERYR